MGEEAMTGAGTPGLLRESAPSAAPGADLDADLDADLERFARLTARIVGVPVALIALLEGEDLVFPAVVEPAAGFSAAGRHAAAAQALSRRVVASAAPLLVDDSRTSGLARHGTGDAVVAYAGLPLTDARGGVLGVLCAIDTTARHWTPGQQEDLTDLAAACSAELRLRIASQRAAGAQYRAQSLTHQARQDLTSAELLLRAAEELTGSASVDEVRTRVGHLISSHLKPSYIGLLLLASVIHEPLACGD
ncbi:GAF domain-containing protein [Streptacidiphilus sp. PAMC 29251]